MQISNKKHPHRFSEEIRQLEVDKTNLLFYARERAAANEPIESARAFAKAARMEEEIAPLMEAEGYLQDAVISWVSAASCYHLGHNLAEALRICELVEKKPFGERYRDILQKIKIDCEKRMATPVTMTGDREHRDSPHPIRINLRPIL
ncbi:hypothetical protein FJZ31_20565 [Candidatus Poribacteria bacterium]|nr:hypothetical protein [Candidatus Poribacteria bacterium]